MSGQELYPYSFVHATALAKILKAETKVTKYLLPTATSARDTQNMVWIFTFKNGANLAYANMWLVLNDIQQVKKPDQLDKVILIRTHLPIRPEELIYGVQPEE